MDEELKEFEREFGGGGSRKPEARDASGRRRRPWLPFVSGLLLGIAAALVLPPLLRPYMPSLLRDDSEVAGLVVAEQREEDRLLLTVRTDRGAILATFDRRVAEIELLVSRGDTVVLGLGEVRPFVENPELRAVRKAEEDAAPARERPAPEEATPEEAAPAEPAGEVPAEGGEEAPPPTAPEDTAGSFRT